ncbi:MAG: glutamyl-tRNA reductase [Planctomycetia bacterium]|nr:glutamyl-tRNA reductase [Planctomycetia bacterium]
MDNDNKIIDVLSSENRPDMNPSPSSENAFSTIKTNQSSASHRAKSSTQNSFPFHLRMIGVSHHSAPIEVREKLSFKKPEVVEKLQQWRKLFGNYEAVLISTCNRTEFYFASQNNELPDDFDILNFLLHSNESSFFSNEKSIDKTLTPHNSKERSVFADFNHKSFEKNFFKYCITLSNQEAVFHLFSVVSSLDSMVLGESQILSQVKNAYQLAAENGSTGPITHAVFQTSLRVAKRISTETGIFQHRVSIPSVAVVDFALRIFERLDDKKTLVLGAGEMAEETLKYLSDNGAKTITVVNRNRSHAEKLAAQWNGSVFNWEKRLDMLADSDIVIAATGANEPIITLNQFRSISPKRKGRPLFMLDLSMPRNIDPLLNQCSDVYLYSIDDLKDACEQNRKSRLLEIPKAQNIIQQETDLFLQEMNRRSYKDVIRQLREGWDEIKNNELQRLLNKCSPLDKKTESEIRYAFDRLVNKLLHLPMESLRNESQNDSSVGFLDFFKRLFRL